MNLYAGQDDIIYENFDGWEHAFLYSGQVRDSKFIKLCQVEGESQIISRFREPFDKEVFHVQAAPSETWMSFKYPLKALELDCGVEGGARFSCLDAQKNPISGCVKVIEMPYNGVHVEHLNFESLDEEIHHLKLEVYEIPEEENFPNLTVDNIKMVPLRQRVGKKGQRSI